VPSPPSPARPASTGAATEPARPPASPGRSVSPATGPATSFLADGDTIRKVVIATGAVTTLAGTPNQTGSTNATGAAARFYFPIGVASDGAGNLFVADNGNSVIRKVVIATGAVTTLAGTPGHFDSVDGTGAAAVFSGPVGIVSDGAGDLFVTDGTNRTIRKIVVATRAVTTLAGMPGPDSSVDGTGSDGRFSGPGGIVSDGAGNLYITDTDADGGAIRKLVIATGAVTTLAGVVGQGTWGSVDGTGADARFGGPVDLTTDGAGNLYVADTAPAGGSIRRVAIQTAAVTTLAGAPGRAGNTDGAGAAARFKQPGGLASDGAGNLYVADTNNDIIRKVVVATGEVTTLAGTGVGSGSADGTGTAASFYEPGAIAADGAGNLYVGDAGRLIRKIVAATGVVTTLAGSANDPYPGYVDGVGAAARFNGPTGIASDGAGNLYVADAGNNCIRKIVVATATVTTLAGAAGQPAGSVDGIGAAARFTSPNAIAADGAGNLLVAGNNCVRKVVIATAAVSTLAGTPGQSGSLDGTGAAARFTSPSAIASDGAGNLYLSDNHTIRKVVVGTAAVSTIIGVPDLIGVSLGAFPSSLNDPSGLAVLPTGELAIIDTAENAVLMAHL
jgi:hypothetical protein